MGFIPEGIAVHRPRGAVLVIEEAPEEEPHQESDHHEEDNDWAWDIAHNQFPQQAGREARFFDEGMRRKRHPVTQAQGAHISPACLVVGR